MQATIQSRTKPSRRATARQAGFSLLELVIVITLVIVLFLVAVNRLMPLRGDAEAAHVATVIGGLRSAIGLESAARVTRKGLSGLIELQGANPMEFLQDWPEQYIGPVDSIQSDAIAGGRWYFDTSTNTVGYRVRFPEYLEGGPAGPVDLRWRVELQFDDRGGTGQFDPDTDRIHGLRLVPLHHHRWPDQPGAPEQLPVSQ